MIESPNVYFEQLIDELRQAVRWTDDNTGYMYWWCDRCHAQRIGVSPFYAATMHNVDCPFFVLNSVHTPSEVKELLKGGS